MASHEETQGLTNNRSHVMLMAEYVEAFYQVCKIDQQWSGNQVIQHPKCPVPEEPIEEEGAGAARPSGTLAEQAHKSIQEQWNRSVFLEDPANKIGHLDGVVKSKEGVFENKSDEAISRALAALNQIQAQYLPRAPLLTHLKPVSWITGKLTHLIDLRVLIVERIPADHYAAFSKSVSDWTFLVLADETGSVVGAFHPELPKSIARKLALMGGAGGAKGSSPKKLTELLRVGDVCGFIAIKTISLFGTTMVAFSTKSNVTVLGTYMYDYAVQFGPRQG